jgi:hypothetical protein
MASKRSHAWRDSGGSEGVGTAREDVIDPALHAYRRERVGTATATSQRAGAPDRCQRKLQLAAFPEPLAPGLYQRPGDPDRLSVALRPVKTHPPRDGVFIWEEGVVSFEFVPERCVGLLSGPEGRDR